MASSGSGGGVSGPITMKQYAVQCSVPAPSFPPLSVARRVIHNHISAPFAVSCSPCPCPPRCESPKTLSLPAPHLIINHTCPCSCPPSPSPPSVHQQVRLIDFPANKHTHDDEDVEYGSVSAWNAANCSLCATQVADAETQTVPLSHKKHMKSGSAGKKRPIPWPLVGVAEDGSALAAELLRFLKDSICLSLPLGMRSKVSEDWVSILSSNIFEECMDKSKGKMHRIPLWVLHGSCFVRVIDKVSQIKVPDDSPHMCIEDLLLTILSFEKAGLVNKLKGLGMTEVACILGDRSAFYGLFARARIFQEASNLLSYMRSVMRIPARLTWSIACNNDPHRKCLHQICDNCRFHDKIKTFAWKLDKLEIVLKDVDCIKKYRVQNTDCISARIRKLLDSPLGDEVVRLQALSYLDTAVCLIQRHRKIFKILEEHGFSGK